MKYPLDLSVVICTYNGGNKLPTVLEKLRSQREVDNINWEIIVVDNNSNDRTQTVIKEYQKLWTTNVPLNYYFEPRQGLAFARRLGVKQARGELIGLLDDDNWPTENWVTSVCHFAALYPQGGAYGSKLLGAYETKPPENFDQIACFLGIIDRSDQPFRYDLLKRWLFPAGAGLVVRKQAWLESVPETFLLTGVSGNSLARKGEDIETLSYLRLYHWQIWHNPEAIIYHHIPQYRLKKSYLLELFRGVGLSRFATPKLQRRNWQFPLWLLLYFFTDLYKLIFHYIKYYASFESNLIARCQLQLLIYTLVSPFCYWRVR
jgi:glycosyltransferase involved in cell wall biosynthesis